MVKPPTPTKRGRQGRGRKPRDPEEGLNRLLDLRRVTRVVSGGRRFSFRATVVAGTKNGEVGVGTGKGTDTALAIEKGLRRAKANFVKFPITKDKSIPYEVEAKFGASRLKLKPARKGRGLIAGGAVRLVLEFAGVENASAKMISRGTNKLNNALCAVEALKKLK
ncbi:MAG: 30S ribosomal protein S5 [bacterium]|nr:30S ribosomal protein S5 [bacterium]